MKSCLKKVVVGMGILVIVGVIASFFSVSNDEGFGESAPTMKRAPTITNSAIPVFTSTATFTLQPSATPFRTPTVVVIDALGLYDSNKNGRITCKEAREHGIAPVPREHPAYQYMNDRDGDGVVCE